VSDPVVNAGAPRQVHDPAIGLSEPTSMPATWPVTWRAILSDIATLSAATR